MSVDLDHSCLDLCNYALSQDRKYFIDVVAGLGGGLHEGDVLLFGESQALLEGNFSSILLSNQIL